MDESDRQWHLDKRVNVSIIVVLVAQAALGLTWANRVSFDIDLVKQNQQEIQQALREQDRRVDTLSTVVTHIEGLREDIKKLTARFDLVIELRTKVEQLREDRKKR